MRSAILLAVLLAFSCVAYADGIYNIGGGGNYDVTDGYLIAGIGNQGPPPVCTPGSTNGHMDFSVCSNIGITAALP